MNTIPSAPHQAGGRIKQGERDKALSMEPGESGLTTQEILVVPRCFPLASHLDGQYPWKFLLRRDYTLPLKVVNAFQN